MIAVELVETVVEVLDKEQTFVLLFWPGLAMCWVILLLRYLRRRRRRRHRFPPSNLGREPSCASLRSFFERSSCHRSIYQVGQESRQTIDM